MNAKMNTITTPMLLKSSEAAKLLSISERTLFTLTKDGTIPSVRLGRSVRYDVDMLRKLISDQQAGQGDFSGSEGE